MAEERDKSKIARLGVVEMSRDAKEVDGVALCVEKTSATEIVDAEPYVVQKLVSANSGDKADMRQAEDTPDGILRNGCVVRPLQKVEETEHHG